MFMDIRKTFALLLSLSLLHGCGSMDVGDYLPDQRLAYKKQREAEENLELPPDLTAGRFDDAMDVPDLGGSATYSEYQNERRTKRQIAVSREVLPEVKDVTLQRAGDRRWLEISASPQQVWPRLVAFWREQGILLAEQDPAAGILKTDWLENRADIRKDFVTRTLRKVVDGLYATSTRDQYRVRIEPGLKGGTTDLYLTHRGMEERLVSNTVGEGANSVWEPSGSDPDKEAAMLRRLMVYLGVTEARAERVIAEQRAQKAGARLIEEGGHPVLVIDDDFRNAWRTTGVALDRVGFAVEDRDRSQGLYYVRYDDPDQGMPEKPGMLSKLAFWKRDRRVDTVTPYQVKLTASGAQTRVEVRDRAGRADRSTTARRILTLLSEQLRGHD